MLSRRSLVFAPPLSILRGQNSDRAMFANAEAYERFMGRWSLRIAPLLIDFAVIPDAGRVLDVGSGTGSLALAIAEARKQTRVIGIDPSKEYAAYAGSRNTYGDRVQFLIGDAQSLHFPDSGFDAAISLLVFNFIPDFRKALREIARTTKPGGIIAAAVWDYGGHMPMLRAFWDAAVETDATAEKRDEKHMPLCRAGELSNLWKQAGLRNVSEKPLEIAMDFASFADYWDPFLLGQGPAGAYVRTLPDDRLQALRKAVKRRLSVASETDRFTLPARVWAVRGIVPPKQ